MHVIGKAVYSGFHGGCDGDSTTRATGNDVSSGARDTAFRPTFDQFWGRDIAGDATRLVLAGDFTTVSGVAARGFAIFPPRDTTPPAAPAGLSAAEVGSTGQVELAWDAATDDRAVSGYLISRDGQPLATTPATSYADTDVGAGETHSYTVRAYDYDNNASSDSPAATVAVAGSFQETWSADDGAPWTPAGWTSDGSNGVVDVRSGRGRLAPFDQAGGYARTALTGFAPATDLDVTFSYQWSTNAAASYLAVYVRGSGGWQNAYRPYTGYGVELSSTSSSATVSKNVNGTLTTMGVVGSAQAVTTARQWLRLRVVGQQLMLRTWLDGSAEPTAWAYTASDNSVTAGGLLYLSQVRSSNNGGAGSASLDDLAMTASPPGSSS